MGKSVILSLSFLLIELICNGQNTNIKPVSGCDCTNKKTQDSLVQKYLDSGAEKHSYNSIQWQLYCDSIIEICPNIAVAYQLKAIPFIKYGQYEKAFLLEDKAVELDPKGFTAYRGFLKCIFTKDYDGSILDFKKAQQLIPNSYEMDHTYLFYEGLCNLELGNYSKAEANFKKDIFIQTKGDTLKTVHFNTLFYLGVLYYEMKKFKIAQKYFLKCIAIYKQHSNANYYLALVYKKMKNYPFENKYLQFSKQAFINGYGLNEDNVYYAYYPHQITLYEIEEAIKREK